MRRSRRDAGLSLRIALSLVGLVILYVPLLVWIAGISWFVGGVAGVACAEAVLVFLLLRPLWRRDGVAGAVRLEAADAPQLRGAVERLCALADIPAPALALLPVTYPNAFTFARTPSRHTVVVTQGLLDRLEPPEVEAIVAHELAHIAHRDAFVMTLVSAPARALRAAVVAPAKRLQGRGLAVLLVCLLPVVVAAWCANVVATMLVLTLSRYRELLADRGAALLTGRPETLMSALQKISGRLAAIPTADLRDAAAWNPFFVMPTERAPGVFELDPFVLFPTHPPLQRRLERLAALQRTGRPIAEAPPRPANPRAGLAFQLALATWPLAWGAYLFGNQVAFVGLLAAATWLASFVFAVQAIGAAQRGASGGRVAATTLLVLAAPVLVTIVLGSALALAGE